MILDYPIASIVGSILVTFLVATLVGELIARAGFLLPIGNRVGCIDGLRGYLALSVLAHHFIIWIQISRLGGSWSAPTVNFFNNLGAGGVALFFMTTGFVFYPRVLAGFRATSWTSTYTSRVFRIVPLIIVSVALITGIISLRTGHGFDASFPKAAAEWITSWGEPPLLGYADSGRLNAYVLWSLWHEWLFYLFVLPTCALGMDLIRGRAPSWTIPLGLLLISLVFRRCSWLRGTSQFLPLFAVGMLAFECQLHDALRQVLRGKLFAITALVSLVIGMVSAPTPYNPVQVALYGFFFICIACGNDLIGLLRTNGSLVLGECSYGIYLMHGIFLSLLFWDGASAIRDFSANKIPVLLPFVALGVVCVTAVSFLVIEQPAIRAGSAISNILRLGISRWRLSPAKNSGV